MSFSCVLFVDGVATTTEMVGWGLEAGRIHRPVGTSDSKEATEALPVEVGQAGRGRHQVVKGVVKAGQVGRRGRLQGDAGQGVGALADVGGSPMLAAEGDTGDLGLVADPQHIEMVRSWFLQQYHMLPPIHEKSCLAYENLGKFTSPDFLCFLKFKHENVIFGRTSLKRIESTLTSLHFCIINTFYN